MYEIIDKHTGCVVGKASTLRAASRAVDRRDNAYGAYRYTHRKVSEECGVNEVVRQGTAREGF
jgi:hypothetical protein